MHGYIAVVLSRPSGGYRVEFPALPGCRCAASGVEEGLARASRALRTYAAALDRQGLALPPAEPASLLVAATARLGARAAACLRAPRQAGAAAAGAPDLTSQPDSPPQRRPFAIRTESGWRRSRHMA